MIGGQNYSFLFDTGSGTSAISGSVAAAHGFKYSPSKTVTYDISQSRKRTVMLTEPVSVKIGGKQVTSQFDVSESYRNSVYDGIIGMDIISKYNWLFDFDEKTLSVSGGFLSPLPNESWTKETSYRYTKSFGVPFVSMTINASKKMDFYFDTGMYDGYYDAASQKYLYYAFVYNDGRNISTSRYKPMMESSDRIARHINSNELYDVMYSLNGTVNGVRHPSFASAIYTNEGNKYKILRQRKLLNIVTVNYLHYFDGMFINSMSHKISFYNKPGKSSRDDGNNVEWFYNKDFSGFNNSY